MNALISGASGFIGQRLRQALAQAGPAPRCLVRRPSGAAHEVLGDLDDSSALAAACAEVETVYHCAGYAHAFQHSDADAHWRINFEGTRKLLAAAGAARVRRFVFLSSVKAMAEPGAACADEDWPGAPDTAYGRAKRAAEDAVLEAGVRHGMHVVNLRLSMVYGRGGRGNLERMAAGIRAGWFPPLPETGNRRSLVHVQDVVQAMRLVAARPQANARTYIVADTQAYSGRALYAALCAALERQAPRWQTPAWAFHAGARVGDALGTVLGRALPLNSEVLQRLLGSAWYSPARIERELGWRAQVGLAQGLRELLGQVPSAPSAPDSDTAAGR